MGREEFAGDLWPSIEDGERTDRGWEHYLRMFWEWNIGLNETVNLRLVVPPREAWIIEYVSWRWSGVVAGPTWTSAKMVRELRRGLAWRKLLASQTPWEPMALALEQRTLYSVPTTDEEIGRVNRSQIEPHLCGLRPGAAWGFDWLDNTIVATEADTVELALHVIRIPVATPRVWSMKDMENTLTAIDEMSRRVS